MGRFFIRVSLSSPSRNHTFDDEDNDSIDSRVSFFWRSWQRAAAKRVGEMNRHGHSTDRVRGVGEFGAMGPGVEGRRHCTFRFVVRRLLWLLLLMMLMLFWFSVGRSFVYFVSRFPWKLEIEILFLIGFYRERLFLNKSKLGSCLKISAVRFIYFLLK